MSEYILVLCTIDNREKAAEIAQTLVKNKLCACVNILPDVVSIYSWKNKIEKDNEYIMLIKTRKELFSTLKNEIIKLHTYEVPEIISLNIKDGNENYLSWIKGNTKN